MQTQQQIKARYFAKKREQAPEIQCACGCGEVLKAVDNYGRPVSFISGHNARKYKGDDATRWSAQKRYRRSNANEYRQYRRDYYRTRKLRAMELLGNKCHYCGIEHNGKNAPIFEFHHLDPSEKESGVTRMLTNQAWEKTVEELQKCVLTCANCHNQYHGGEW